MSISYKRSTQEDLVRVSEFRKGHFAFNPSVRCYESAYYRWKCFENPFHPGEVWLSEDEGEIVGLYTCTPKRLKVLDNVIEGIEVGDSFTHPNFRRRGISTRLGTNARDSVLSRGFSFIYNIPSGISWARDSTKLGYSEIPARILQMIKPVSRSIFQSDFRISRRLKFALYPAALYSPFLAIKAAFTKHNWPDLPDLFVRKADSFPGDLDTFGIKASKKFDVMLVCTQEYLTWRYLRNPDAYTILVASDKNQTTKGYLVLKVGYYDDVAVGYIVDFLTLGEPGVFEKLLTTAISEFRWRKVSYIHTWVLEHSEYAQVFSRCGFQTYLKSRISCFQNDLGKFITANGLKWHFTMGCSDTI